MNVYILQKYLNVFLEKLKENDNIDDFILDKVRLGKQKIILSSKTNMYDTIESLVPSLPKHSLIVNDTEHPGHEYILCVGEIPISEISFFQKNKLDLTIITKKNGKIRFNSWIHLSKLEELHTTNIIENFSSVNGKIQKHSYFIFETDRHRIDLLCGILSNISNEYIIRDNKIYVKLLLKDFTKSFNQLKKRYTYIEIVDNENN